LHKRICWCWIWWFSQLEHGMDWLIHHSHVQHTTN
jgi:hypothetical protein